MFDLFNKKALKTAEMELFNAQAKVDRIEAEAADLREENERLVAKLRGDRVCDGYCSLCKHGVQLSVFSPVIGNYPKWTCTLDCKCKDFEKEEC